MGLNLFDASEEVSYLIKKDSNNKIRCVVLQRVQEKEDYFVIKRTTFQYGGKQTNQPDIVITEGKAKRDATAQAILQYNAKLKEYKDKGYKEIEKHPEEYSLIELDSILPKVSTDANGFAKHMLAKSSDKVKQSSIDKVKYWYASRKIDGVRCSFYWNGKKILTASRGGGTYEFSTQHITQNSEFIAFFKRHPDYILDGELYKHGKQLQEISGAARLEKNAVDCDWLEYYIYDVMIPDKTFYDRLQILKEIKEELNLGFDPYKLWQVDELQLQMVPQEKVSGYDNIMELHNKYVEEGWEGVVIRNPDKVYGFGKRTNDMLKIKRYKDSEFLVTGYELGLRGIEDMVFICATSFGKSFKAKPMGDKLTKEEYVNNFDSKYKDHIATVKYFYYSNGNDEVNGVPLQPCLIAFRDKKDM
nr:MAG TPA: adenylation DNA ligase-like protein [Caudoviricetes sp.]